MCTYCPTLSIMSEPDGPDDIDDVDDIDNVGAFHGLTRCLVTFTDGTNK